jgi:Cu2+-exporting ATPase
MSTAVGSGTGCFHCGEPMPAEARWPVRVAGSERQTCCPGCQAACETIVTLGLENYYLHRDRYSPRAGDSPVPEHLFASFSDASMADGGYVAETDDGSRECTLIVEDLRCAACGWLIEKSLHGLPGVRQSSVNVTSGRVRVRWQPGVVELRDILLRVRKLGYRVLPFRDGQRGSRLDAERRASLLRLVVAGFGMMQVMHVAVGFYWDAADSMGIAHRDYLRVISAFITMPVVFFSGFPFLRNAWNSLRAGAPGMDVPVALAILLAYFASLWAVAVDGPEVWFDSVVMFVFFLLLGRHLELEARRRATRVIDNLSASLPLVATRFRDGIEEIVPAGQVRVGDIVRVQAGETIPLDGAILEGRGHVNEAMLTGESQPVMRIPGDRLTGGCTSIDGLFRVQVTAPASGGRLSRIVDLVNRAQADKPALQELADRIATHFVVALLLLTLATWVAWHFFDPDRAFWVALAVLVVSCPCALSLATPAAHTVATNLLTGHGLLLTRGRVLSALPGLGAVVFDKTGTLTEGRPVLREIRSHTTLPDTRVLALATALERDSEHPLARAFHAASPPGALAASDVRVVPGAGIEGTVEGVRYRIGSRQWATQPSFTRAGHLPATSDGAWVWLADADNVLASFLVGDGERRDAAATVHALQRQGIEVHLLSGDASGEASRLASALGIRCVRAGASPEEKVEYLQALRLRLGRPVMMAGDGVNDAPVLAAADISVAMGEGTDLARTAADAVLLRPRLMLLAEMIAVAEAMRRTVRQNLGWALGYNLAMIPLAVAGYMPPWLAAIGMSASSLVVVLNALALGRRAARHPIHNATATEPGPSTPS